MINIAIDGPSGAGKSWLARQAASTLGFVYVDTGALYRAVGLAMARRGIDPKTDGAAVEEVLSALHITLEYHDDGQHVFSCGEDVTGLLRTPEISMMASAVATLPTVRTFLLETQREIARTYDTVMDGRDIGSVILPDAAVKIFLTARDEVRAHRRWLELAATDPAIREEDVLADMSQRDLQDRTREVAPALPAADAVLLDNSDLDREETLAHLLAIVRYRLTETGIPLPAALSADGD